MAKFPCLAGQSEVCLTYNCFSSDNYHVRIRFGCEGGNGGNIKYTLALSQRSQERGRFDPAKELLMSSWEPLPST